MTTNQYNGAKNLLTPDNHALLLIDHQEVLSRGVERKLGSGLHPGLSLSPASVDERDPEAYLAE
jgi:hypothetical protein